MGIDAEAIERVYRGRYVGFVKAMMAITGNREDARESVQEGFARALAGRRSYRGDGSIEAWIWRIVFRVALERRRRPTEEPFEDSFALALPGPAVDPVLNDALRDLPKRQRMIVFLYYLADLSYEEIGEAGGISEGTVGASLSHARRALAEALRDQRHQAIATADHERPAR
jgi:DNA-directed RNA polymerase specialized sigma24 family protein